jgi:DNA-directed RNA polymerase III subunit RPC6
VLNLRLRQAQVTISKHADTKEILYHAQGQERATQFKGLGMEDMLVYQLIRDAHDKGIWIRNLKTRSGLQTVQMNKTLKSLESRRLIKSVKTIANRSRKVFMLYELQPHRSLVGGPWMTDSEFDRPFFESLQKLCERFVMSTGFCTSIKVHEFIRNSGVSTVELSLEDVEILLSTLVYDGRLEKFDDPRPGQLGTILYKPTRVTHNAFSVATVPCGICPVAMECHEDGPINPTNCIYLSEWLDPGFKDPTAILPTASSFLSSLPPAQPDYIDTFDTYDDDDDD